MLALHCSTVLAAELTEAMVLVGSPSDYANRIAKQADLATGKIFSCYCSKQRPVPLALLYSCFADFCSRMSSTASPTTRDILFTTELCQTMQGFASVVKHRALLFGKLFREYLQGILSSTVHLKHQLRGQSIVDIRLQANWPAKYKFRQLSSANQFMAFEHLSSICHYEGLVL